VEEPDGGHGGEELRAARAEREEEQLGQRRVLGPPAVGRKRRGVGPPGTGRKREGAVDTGCGEEEKGICSHNSFQYGGVELDIEGGQIWL